MLPRFQTHATPLMNPTRDVRTRTRTMRRSFAVIAAILVGMIATPVLASSYSIDVGSPTISRSRVAVTVPVEVTCPELDPSYTLVSQSIAVSVRQAVHGKIASGLAPGTGELGAAVAGLDSSTDGPRARDAAAAVPARTARRGRCSRAGDGCSRCSAGPAGMDRRAMT